MRRSTVILLVGAGVAVSAGVGALVVSRSDEPSAAPVATASTTATEHSTTTSELVGQPGADGVGDPYFPTLGNGGYDVDHYTLALTWQPDAGTVLGRTTIASTATQDLSRFDLDLVGLEVASVLVDGQPAEMSRVGNELVIDPATDLARGASFTTVVSYSGAPHTVSDGTDLFQVGWQIDGREAYVVSEPSGASTFYPVNDHPTDKATYTFEITAPADQVVAANGLLVGQQEQPDGQKTWTYATRDPMASYLVQIAIGDYELVDGGTIGGVTIRHAFHRSVADAAKQATSRTAEMIDVLDDVYGPYPFETYGVLAVDEQLGYALETQTLTIIGTDIARLGRSADVILLHELSHQWVGDAVSPSSWQDIWLNEGFATYSEWLWSERTGGGSAASLARSRTSASGSSGALDLPPAAPGNKELFSRTVYLRGGMTLQALRERIGDDAFFKVLRAWVDQHRSGSASTAEFIALAETTSGQQLDDLFLAWLYGPTLPSLD